MLRTSLIAIKRLPMIPESAQARTTTDKTAIRNAATVIVVRDRMGADPQVLMGQRGAKAAFMPNKVVFPGGAVDLGDGDVPLATPLPDVCRDRLQEQSAGDLHHALAVAAIRELWEETGLILGTPAHGPQRRKQTGRGLQPPVTCPLPLVCSLSFAPSPRRAAPAGLTHGSF